MSNQRTKKEYTDLVKSALAERAVIWVQGQVTVSVGNDRDTHAETKPEMYDGEIFKGELAGCGLRAMNFGSCSASLVLTIKLLPAQAQGRVENAIMPLDKELAELIWAEASKRIG